jgi:hypothetical protein
MINSPYLVKTVKSNKLSELVACIDAPPLDMNLAMWDAVEAGEIEIDDKKDRVKLLVEPEAWRNPDLAHKLIRTIQHYAKNDTNITRGRMNALLKEPITNIGYPMHEYFMSLEYLIDTGQIVEHVIEVPKMGKRPYHKFVFLCLKGNDNEEWNAKAVSKWISEFEKTKVK